MKHPAASGNGRVGWWAPLLVTALTLMLGCGGPSEINFGAILDESGEASAYGRSVRRGIELAAEQINAEGVKIPSTLKTTSRPGEYLVAFNPATGGIYRIRVETPAGNMEESMVAADSLENLDAAPDHDQLEKIAAATGGKYLTPGADLLKEIEAYARRSEKKFIEEKHLPVWASPFVMAIILTLLSLEWYLRRRWGLA